MDNEVAAEVEQTPAYNEAALEALLDKPEGAEGDNKNKGADKAKVDAPEAPASDEDPETGPEETPVTGDEDEGASDPAEKPVIAAPKSWPADMRDAFAKLPGDLQEVIAKRENERDEAFTRQVREASDKRQAADAELSAASNERRTYLANLSTLIDGLARQTAGEFADIKTTGDLEQMSAQDPQRYLRWLARREAINSAMAEQKVLADREQAEQATKFKGYAQEQVKLIYEKIPELADPKTQKAVHAEMNDYLRSVGFSDDETKQWIDHRYAVVIRDAAKWRKSQQAVKTAADKKVVNLPKVVRSGSSAQQGERSSQDKAAMTRIARHGTTDQQVEALARLLEG